MKINRRSVLLLLLIWCAVGIILINAGEKLTYLEYTYINENTEDTLTVDNTEVVIEQDFTPRTVSCTEYRSCPIRLSGTTMQTW